VRSYHLNLTGNTDSLVARNVLIQQLNTMEEISNKHFLCKNEEIRMLQIKID